VTVVLMMLRHPHVLLTPAVSASRCISVSRRCGGEIESNLALGRLTGSEKHLIMLIEFVFQ